MNYILQNSETHGCEYTTNSYAAARIIELRHNQEVRRRCSKRETEMDTWQVSEVYDIEES